MSAKYQSSKKKILNTKTAVIVLLVVLILISLSIAKNAQEKKLVDQSADKLEDEIAQLEQQNLDLNNLIEFFASEEFIERESREKLNLAKPGERVVIVPEESRDIIRQELENDNNQKGSPKLWWDYFFK